MTPFTLIRFDSLGSPQYPPAKTTAIYLDRFDSLNAQRGSAPRIFAERSLHGMHNAPASREPARMHSAEAHSRARSADCIEAGASTANRMEAGASNSPRSTPRFLFTRRLCQRHVDFTLIGLIHLLIPPFPSFRFPISAEANGEVLVVGMETAEPIRSRKITLIRLDPDLSRRS
jgi:hypothetical protein